MRRRRPVQDKAAQAEIAQNEPAYDDVAETMAAVGRADFLPAQYREYAAADQPLSIGHGQTNSQPRTVENMLRLLDVRPGQKVLDIGAGSGWTTALLAELTGPQGRVIATELVPELAGTAAAAVREHSRPWAEVRQAEQDVLGVPSEAPFDRVLVSAEAQTLPRELVAQLAEGGLMVIPVSGRMLRVRRNADDSAITTHGAYRFVPLK